MVFIAVLSDAYVAIITIQVVWDVYDLGPWVSYANVCLRANPVQYAPSNL